MGLLWFDLVVFWKLCGFWYAPWILWARGGRHQCSDLGGLKRDRFHLGHRFASAGFTSQIKIIQEEFDLSDTR